MRGHVDMEDVSKQFDAGHKELNYSDSTEKRLDEMIARQKLSDAMAAKLLSENSHLQQRVRQLEEENAALKSGNHKNVSITATNIVSLSPRK